MGQSPAGTLLFLTFFSSASSPSLSFFLRPRPAFLSRTFLGFFPIKHFL